MRRLGAARGQAWPSGAPVSGLTRLFLASASWAAGTDSRAFLSPSLSPPWQQTYSKRDASLGSRQVLTLSSHCPHSKGEENKAQRLLGQLQRG